MERERLGRGSREQIASLKRLLLDCYAGNNTMESFGVGGEHDSRKSRKFGTFIFGTRRFCVFLRFLPAISRPSAPRRALAFIFASLIFFGPAACSCLCFRRSFFWSRLTSRLLLRLSRSTSVSISGNQRKRYGADKIMMISSSPQVRRMFDRSLLWQLLLLLEKLSYYFCRMTRQESRRDDAVDGRSRHCNITPNSVEKDRSG